MFRSTFLVFSFLLTVTVCYAQVSPNCKTNMGSGVQPFAGLSLGYGRMIPAQVLLRAVSELLRWSPRLG